MPNQTGKVVLVLILFLLILGAAAYFFIPGFKKQDYKEKASNYSHAPEVNNYEVPKSEGEMKNYYSSSFKINFIIPSNAQIDEKSTIITIILQGGEISLIRAGTNYENISDYYSDLKLKNNLTPLSYQEGKTKKYDFVITTDEPAVNEKGMEKTYFIYTENKIFSFSTSEESLYPVLDQIVQSFEYKP